MKQLLVGTNNRHKASEISAMLSGLSVRVLTPEDAGIEEDPVEDGATFEENARIKARFFARLSGLPCLADDSGLEVDALGGRPGIYSSRYAASDAERIAKLLGELSGVPARDRSARFVCCAALAFPEPDRGEVVERGTCEGVIATSPAGENGFGYDPVFFLPDLGKTMAEISSEEKNRRSHRGRALAAMRDHLQAILSDAD